LVFDLGAAEGLGSKNSGRLETLDLIPFSGVADDG
jgi:hypothetical protein